MLRRVLWHSSHQKKTLWTWLKQLAETSSSSRSSSAGSSSSKQPAGTREALQNQKARYDGLNANILDTDILKTKKEVAKSSSSDVDVVLDEPSFSPSTTPITNLSGWNALIEKQIKVAQSKGVFDKNPGHGKPLPEPALTFAPPGVQLNAHGQVPLEAIPSFSSLKAAQASLLEGLQRSQYPVVPLPKENEIQVLTDSRAINNAMKPIHDLLEALGDDESIICGLDCEWTVFPTRQPISLIQLAIDIPAAPKKVFLIRCMSFTREGFPVILKKVLEHPKLKKAGSYVFSTDCRLLLEDYGINIPKEDCIILNQLAKTKGKTKTAVIGLKRLCEIILNHTIPKPDAIRVSNWSSQNLSKSKIEYAARDSWASLQLANRLLGFETAFPTSPPQTPAPTATLPPPSRGTRSTYHTL